MPRLALLLLTALLLMSCASNPPAKLATPSGLPEITVSGVSKKAVIDAIVARSLERGAVVKSVTDYEVVTGKPADSLTLQLLFGSKFNGTPEVRSKFSVVDTPAGVRVFSRVFMVTNPDSGFESAQDMTTPLAKELQAVLDDVASRALFATTPRN